MGELDEAIDAVASQLGRLDVGAGTPVAIQLPNVIELPITLLACARLGAVAVPFPIQHRSHELRSGLPTAQVRAVVTGERPDRPDQVTDVADVIVELASTGAAAIGLAAFGPTSQPGVDLSR
ncbi:MAG: AMP-binding protein [Acidimicrobiales bacterium]